MTELHFEKWQATGNDFVIMDFSEGTPVELTTERIAGWCDRKFGIGADGFMYLKKHDQLAFQMHYYNSDGREAEMCGNGARSIMGFAHNQGYFGHEGSFQAIDGPHHGKVLGENHYRIQMVDVNQVIQVNIPGLEDLVAGSYDEALMLNTGVPHLVIFVKDLALIDVKKTGRILRYAGQFKPAGTNVNFVQIHHDFIQIRTYERGVEDETLSCGTGATASAIAASLLFDFSNHQQVKVEGGSLQISFNRSQNDQFKDVWLEGPAKKVFAGVISFD